MTFIKLFLAAAALTIGMLQPAAAQEGPQRLPAIRLTAGFHLIEAELAQTPQQRQIGLMNRPSLPPNGGMLFAFEVPAQQCFWMKNTLLPLSIAFLAEDGTIVNIEDMQPQSLASHCSKQPVRYALEMSQGWFAKRGIKPGAKLTGAPFRR
jgi:uncharacterized membrane protein (UPF0127 family)